VWELQLADEMTQEDASVIVAQWSFPLHSLDLRKIEVDIEQLPRETTVLSRQSQGREPPGRVGGDGREGWFGDGREGP
jgi:hypothetical protein